MGASRESFYKAIGIDKKTYSGLDINNPGPGSYNYSFDTI